MDFDALGWIKSSKHRIEIIKALINVELTPKEISSKINLNLSNVSSYLGPMVKKNLVICLNSSLRKGRIYALSKKGKELSKAIGIS
jgi:predicted transcriptional regulator